MNPFRIAPFFSPRPWGSRDLRPWYPSVPKEPIGEAWLTGQECLLDGGEYDGVTLGQLVRDHAEEILGMAGGVARRDFPLLLKLLFPQDKLSVQVHPDDADAALVGEPRGKTECWYVLSAKPEATIALGLLPGTTRETIREAVADRTLEQLLNWIPISAGDMIYVDAGTVHAIGPGAVLLETQQYSDSTYRLYDYGRPRQLHLDLALRVLKLDTEAGKVSPVHGQGWDRLIRTPYFLVDRLDLWAGERRKFENATATVHCLVPLKGAAILEVRRGDPLRLEPGRAVVVPAMFEEYTLTAQDSFVCVRAMPPGEPGGIDYAEK